MKGEENMSACAVEEEKSKGETSNDEATLRRGGMGWMGGTGAGFGGAGGPSQGLWTGRSRRTAWADRGLRGVGGRANQARMAGSGFRLVSWRQQGKLPALND